MKKLIVLLVLAMSVTSYTQWTVPDSSNIFKTLCTNGTDLFAAGYNGGIFKSVNQGTNWVEVYSNHTYTTSLAYQNNIYMASSGGVEGIRKSTDNGTTWFPFNGFQDSARVYSMAGLNGVVYAGTLHGIYKYMNGSWQPARITSTPLQNSLGVCGSTLLYSTSTKIFRSTNYSLTWDSTSQTIEAYSYASLGTVLYAGAKSNTFNGVWKSLDNGATWTYTGGASLPNQYYTSLISTGGMLIAGTSYYSVNQYSGVYVSTDGGDSWIKSTPGYIYGEWLTVVNSYVYFVAGWIFRNTLSNVIAVEQLSTTVPKDYKLSQNYPNPFNPSTRIEFKIQRATDVKLTVYDIQGKVLTVLVNKQLRPGTYQSDWDASQVATGVYLYKLTAGDYTETKKMILIK